MNRLILVGLSMLLYSTTVTAIVCFQCENAEGQKDCISKGQLIECEPSEDACGITLRHGGWGDYPLLFKYCTQLTSCGNNHVQDSRDAWVFNPEDNQCTMAPPSSVCTCCCTSNGCNHEREYCRTPDGGLPCTALEKPKNGFMKCKDGFNSPSKCTFKCRRGFVMNGSPESNCDRFSERDHEAPTCDAVECEALEATGSLEITCTNGNKHRSVCSFTCTSGSLSSPGSELKCILKSRDSDEGVWSRVPPTCACT